MAEDLLHPDDVRELRLTAAFVEAEHQTIELGLLLKDVAASRGLAIDGQTFALTHLAKSCWQHEEDPYLLLDDMIASGALAQIAATIDSHEPTEDLLRP